MRYLLLVLLILLSACSSVITCSDGTVVEDRADCFAKRAKLEQTPEPTINITDNQTQNDTPTILKTDTVMFPLDATQLNNFFSVKQVNFIRLEKNKDGDSSAIRFDRNAYETNFVTTFEYSPSANYKDANLFIKVIGSTDTGGSKTLFSKQNPTGKNTLNGPTYIPTATADIRLEFCAGYNETFNYESKSPYVACSSKLLKGANTQLSVLTSDINLQFSGDKEISKNVTIQNTGDTPLTYFVHIPKGEAYSYKTVDYVDIDPGKKETITIDFSLFDKGVKKTTLYIYALPRGCEPSAQCATKAPINHELEIKLVR